MDAEVDVLDILVHHLDGEVKPAEGALYLGNSDNYSRSLVYAGGQYVLTNSPLNVSYIKGGSGDAGALKSYNSGNIINFGWQNDSVFYRVDDVVHRNICTQTNAKDLNLAGGTGAPTVGLRPPFVPSPAAASICLGSMDMTEIILPRPQV